MKGVELRAKSESELRIMVTDKKVELNELYVASRTKEVNKTHVFKIIKKDIARAKTVISELQKAKQEKQA